MHDYSYYLGFTEANYNMQVDNLGRGGVGGDPEIGNAQAGALTGGNPSYLGRDNANQITLQDGMPGITNQYLFQPIAGAFYAPCTDGGLDMSIVGHEYTHAISNRMVGGPDEGLTSEQGGAMGESWGDLVAAEYHVQPRLLQRRQPLGRRPLRHRQHQVAGIRDYADQQEPAELRRLRVRLDRRRGARRRRDLERHPVGGPPGAGRRSTTRSSRTPTRRSSSGARRPPPTARPRRSRPRPARATGAGSS